MLSPAPSSPGPSSPVLTALGFDDARGADLAALPGHPEAYRPARITRVDRSLLDAIAADGPVRVTAGGDVLDATAADSTAAPVTGDWVALRDWPDGRVTADAVLPRRTALVRAVASGASHGQVLAANMDAVAVLVGLDVEPDLGRLERLVALSWESGATPLVVLTKADTASDVAVVRADAAAAAPGVDVLAVSARTGEGIGDLRPFVAPGRTLALVGQSGVGKSTLVNALAGAPLLATREIRADGKGRHTTTTRDLVLLPGGGAVIDTPGLRGVGLWSADDGVEAVFPEIDALAGACRFADCGHVAEPGCAVLAAVADGSLPGRRYDSWRKLAREAAWIARRTDARLRAEERARWKSVHRSLRRSGAVRP